VIAGIFGGTMVILFMLPGLLWIISGDSLLAPAAQG